MKTVFAVLLFSCFCLAQLPPKDFTDHNGKKWTIVLHAGVVYDSACDDNECDALTEPGKHRVTLRSDVPLKVQQDLLWHELIHVLTDCKDKTVPIHDVIYQIGPRLGEMVRWNPKLLQFLQAHDLQPIIQSDTDPRRRPRWP